MDIFSEKSKKIAVLLKNLLQSPNQTSIILLCFYIVYNTSNDKNCSYCTNCKST